MHALKMVAALALFAWLGAACQCGGPGVDEGGDGGEGAGADGGESSGDGGAGGGSGNATAPFPKENACHSVTQGAALSKKPVDIIMVIDNSCSMTAEIEAVENNVNVNFAQIIEQSGIDYRVILLAKHGSASADQSVCIRSPLSGTTCNPIPSQPVNGARFFHYDIEISSTNSLQRILSTYDVTDTHGFAPGGWKSWLRSDSVKTFIEITDDESSITADDFESQLFAKAGDMFGSATARNYIFHSIIGITPRNPVTEPYLPTDPRQGPKCSSAARAGPRYEDLSIRTGGLRFPVCETGSYDAVFKAAAEGVIASAKVGCEFTPPAPPEGMGYNQAYVEYTPGNGGAVEYFLQVPSTAECDAKSFTRDDTTNKITLCPDACTKVTTDEGAQIAVLFACGPKIN